MFLINGSFSMQVGHGVLATRRGASGNRAITTIRLAHLTPLPPSLNQNDARPPFYHHARFTVRPLDSRQSYSLYSYDATYCGGLDEEVVPQVKGLPHMAGAILHSRAGWAVLLCEDEADSLRQRGIVSVRRRRPLNAKPNTFDQPPKHVGALSPVPQP